MVCTCRQPLSAGQCCQSCKADDFGAILWSSNLTLLQQQMPVTLGNSVVPLSRNLPASASTEGNTTLRQVFLSAVLSDVCQASASTCTQPVRWRLSSWSACSTSCGGGVSTRLAACINEATGNNAALTCCYTDKAETLPYPIILFVRFFYSCSC
jgi:hypothetical protein